VAIATHPEQTLEGAMRLMHPFPIFERFVEKDIVIKGKVEVTAGSQVRATLTQRGLQLHATTNCMVYVYTRYTRVKVSY
jgi:hypothetical protein